MFCVTLMRNGIRVLEYTTNILPKKERIINVYTKEGRIRYWIKEIEYDVYTEDNVQTSLVLQVDEMDFFEK